MSGHVDGMVSGPFAETPDRQDAAAMTDRPGRLWAEVQTWLDTFPYRPPAQRELAPKLHVSASTLGDYKYARSMPPPEFLIRLAAEIRTPYETLLAAALEDHGYRGPLLERIREDVMGNAEHPAPMTRKTRLKTAREREAEEEMRSRRDVWDPPSGDENSGEAGASA